MRRLLSALAACLLVVVVAVPATATSRDSHAVHYYLSLGDSLAAGVQPTGDPADGHRTSAGYPDQLYQLARGHYPKLRHVKLGCPGETTASMIDGGICAYRHGSQLDEAMAFLRAHRRFVSFVTIDIGWNDFPCRTGVECIQPGTVTIGQNLPTILAALREAAGPKVPIVGMNLYDPFLAFWLPNPYADPPRPAQPELAVLSVQAIGGINDFVEGIYAQFGIPVADVEGAFSTRDFATMVAVPPFGEIPVNVARICTWTWTCTPPPLGPDEHANTDGYHAMALAFAAVLWP
jgi:lysophospholipase L1-like esterase